MNLGLLLFIQSIWQLSLWGQLSSGGGTCVPQETRCHSGTPSVVTVMSVTLVCGAPEGFPEAVASVSHLAGQREIR